MWFFRRMLKLPWTTMRSDEEVLKQAEERGQIKCRKRQSRFVGHVMRAGGLEYLITTGKIEGKRDRSRQKEKMIDKLVKWHRERAPDQLIINTWNRELWESMTDNTCLQDNG